MAVPHIGRPLAHLLVVPFMGAMLLFEGASAERIPAFARKYQVSCSLCHAPFPRLTAFGEEFAGNGFVMAGGPPQDTTATADPLLLLQNDLPLAVRMDLYMQALSRKEGSAAATDLQTPWLVKILSGGQITDDVSYYLYFFLGERGEVAGLEDAYLQFSDVLGSGVDLLAGQFQVSDPMFKRELRLEVEDYALYRARVGEARADLTYDRGIMAVTSPWSGGDLVFEVVNGQGLGEASESREYDRDSHKNLALRLSQSLGPLRLGGFVYRGWESAGGRTDNLWVWGPDLTVTLSPEMELNVQYLRRTDSNPFFLEACAAGDVRCFSGRSNPLEIATEGVMAEVVYLPQGPTGRWALSGLLNWVEADRPALSLRLGEDDLLSRYSTGAGGLSYLLARNLRLTSEVAWDFELERARFTLGAVAAF